jgi:hypothetical protein
MTLTNYGLISLLTAFQKISERILQVNNFISTRRNAFRIEISTENAVFTLTDNILPAIN